MTGVVLWLGEMGEGGMCDVLSLSVGFFVCRQVAEANPDLIDRLIILNCPHMA